MSAHPDPTEDPTEPWSPGLGFKQAAPLLSTPAEEGEREAAEFLPGIGI